MKRLFILVAIFILSVNEISAECHKVFVGVDTILSTKSMSELTSGYDQDIQDIKDMIEKEDTQANRDYYQGSLDDVEAKKEKLKKSYSEYGEFLPKLLSKFDTDIESIISNMSTSLGLEIRPLSNQSSGVADYILFSFYVLNTLKPFVSGSMYYELHDVESGQIIWLSNQKKIRMGERDTDSEEWMNNAWPKILISVPKSHDLEQIIRRELEYKSGVLTYKYDNENKKEANAREKGELTVTHINSGEYISFANSRPRNIVEFTLKAKQGVFQKTNTNQLTFIPKEYKERGKLEYQYRTYNCNKKFIQDKLFETFTLERTCFLGQDDSTMMKKIKVPFECEEPYYTVTTSEKITTTVKSIENYRGISKDLKSYQEDKDTYYIYIDADKAKIEQYHVDVKSTRKIHREKYKLNMNSCQYEIKNEDKLIKNMGGRDMLKSEDAGWGFEDDTKIYVTLPSSEKKLSFTWGRLRENGRYSNSKKYKKEIPEIAKRMMGKMNDMATLFRKESKNNQGMEIFKSLYDYPGTPKHVQCGGKVAMESFLIPPLDGLQDPDIDFRIDIRPSTKNEIRIMKKYMKNGKQ